jgi:hypothetical protein
VQTSEPVKKFVEEVHRDARLERGGEELSRVGEWFVVHWRSVSNAAAVMK